jgi:hypothetical protein
MDPERPERDTPAVTHQHTVQPSVGGDRVPSRTGNHSTPELREGSESFPATGVRHRSSLAPDDSPDLHDECRWTDPTCLGVSHFAHTGAKRPQIRRVSPPWVRNASRMSCNAPNRLLPRRQNPPILGQSSSITVTGPSFWMSTSISVRNRPVATVAPNERRWSTTACTSGSACSGRAAAIQLGRRPALVSP